MIDLAVDLVFQLLQMLLVIGLAPLLTGLVRKAKARLLRRRGPPLIQPYRDLARLARKEAVVAEARPGCSASCPISSSPRPGSRRR